MAVSVLMLRSYGCGTRVPVDEIRSQNSRSAFTCGTRGIAHTATPSGGSKPPDLIVGRFVNSPYRFVGKKHLVGETGPW